MKMADMNFIHPGKIAHTTILCLRGPWLLGQSSNQGFRVPWTREQEFEILDWTGLVSSENWNLGSDQDLEKFENLGPFCTDLSVDPCCLYKFSSNFRRACLGPGLLYGPEYPQFWYFSELIFESTFESSNFLIWSIGSRLSEGNNYNWCEIDSKLDD